MVQYVGLDVSMEETSVCVLDESGSAVWEGKVVSEPDAIVRALCRHAPEARKVGLETGPTSTWLWHELLAAWSAMCVQIAVLSRIVMQRTKGDAVCLRLMTMPGVGPMTALAFRAAVDDPARFKHSASVGAYLGLTPRRYSSGEIDRMGRISRCGDPMVRSYLFEAANIMLARSRAANPLKTWGAKLAKRAGFKKARVALARKMAVVLHRMWLDETDFGQLKAA